MNDGLPSLNPDKDLELIPETELVSMPPAETDVSEMEYGERMRRAEPERKQPRTALIVPPERPPEMQKEELESTYEILQNKYGVSQAYCGVLTRLLAGMSFESACIGADVNPSAFMLACSTNPALNDTFHITLEMKGVRALLKMDELADRLENLDYIPDGIKLAIRTRQKIAEIFAPRLLSRTARKKVGESHYKNAVAAQASRKKNIAGEEVTADDESDLDIPEGLEIYVGGKKITRHER